MVVDAVVSGIIPEQRVFLKETNTKKTRPTQPLQQARLLRCLSCLNSCNAEPGRAYKPRLRSRPARSRPPRFRLDATEVGRVCSPLAMDASDDINANALRALERAATSLEKAVQARERDAQEIKSLRSSNESLETRVLHLQEELERERKRTHENGGRIIRTTQAIRNALSEA